MKKLSEVDKSLLNIKFIFCHRQPDRTFKIWGKFFPVCARCTGIYIGTIALLLFQYFAKLVYIEYNLNWFLISLILIIPTGIDGVTQLLKWRESTNLIRLFTGLLGGVGYGILLIILVKLIRVFLL